ncbi:H+/Cl- antiporter ClcA [Methanolinea mesophila]|uniref:chloride channel protein n=1 Tax=Methanolinea mesophila TaxID=547055 RepID=UPI001AE1F296|nr:chloride channel protein [Methanolinea mesophila]MBP1927603.1 H+/Cl- antiporter ClcA [Methanolinea mesophila]
MKIPRLRGPMPSGKFFVVALLLFLVTTGAMVVFLAAQTTVTGFIWQGTRYSPFFILAMTILGGLVVGLTLRHFGDHVGLLQQTLFMFRESGRFEPKYLPGGLLAIFLSLIFGASLGPEMAAVDMGGSVGTWSGDKTKDTTKNIRILSLIGISGALVGFGVFLGATATTSGALYPVPSYAEFIPIDLLYAAVLGLIGGVAGLALVYSYRIFSRAMTPLAGRPVLRGVLGGLVLGLLGIAAPLILFSGQYEFQTVLIEGAALGAATLFLLVVAKILASTWCMATIFKGGPIFPLIFAGGTLGMAISLVFPVIPLTVGITAVMAGMIVCILKSPFVVIPLLILIFFQWGIILVVIVATLVGYLVTKNVYMVPRPKSGTGR